MVAGIAKENLMPVKFSEYVLLYSFEHAKFSPSWSTVSCVSGDRARSIFKLQWQRNRHSGCGASTDLSSDSQLQGRIVPWHRDTREGVTQSYSESNGHA